MKILNLLLALSLMLNSVSALAVDPDGYMSPHVQEMWELVGSTQKNFNSLVEKGASPTNAAALQRAILDVIGQEASLLSPEDFKQFFFESIARYLQYPDERLILSLAWDSIHAWVKPEIDSYQVKVWQPIAEGFGTYLFFFVALRGAGALLRSGAPASEIVNSSFSRRLLSKSGITTEFKQNLIISGVSAVAAAGLQEAMRQMMLQVSTHKFDPKPLFQSFQMMVACDLGNAVLQPNLTREQLTKLDKQAKDLLEQMPQLAKVSTTDPRTQQILASVPQDPALNKLFNYPTSCPTISLNHIVEQTIPGRLAELPDAQDSK